MQSHEDGPSEERNSHQECGGTVWLLCFVSFYLVVCLSGCSLGLIVIRLVMRVLLYSSALWPMCKDFRVKEAAVASVGCTRRDDPSSHPLRLFLMIEVSRPLNSKGEAAARYFCFHIRRFSSAVYRISSTVIAFCIKIPNHHRWSSKHLIGFMIPSGILLEPRFYMYRSPGSKYMFDFKTVRGKLRTRPKFTYKPQ